MAGTAISKHRESCACEVAFVTICIEDGVEDLETRKYELRVAKSIINRLVLLSGYDPDKLYIQDDKKAKPWGGSWLGWDRVMQTKQARLYCAHGTVTGEEATLLTTWAV